MNTKNGKPQTVENTSNLQDNTDLQKPFIKRFREALTKPVTLVIAGIVFTVSVFAEYAISRAMDAIWEVEPPEEVIKLNSDLQSASGQLQATSKDLKSLLSRIDQSKVEDPKLRTQLEQLNNKLLSLNELVKKTSKQTDKVATISEALQDDWTRVKRKSDGWIDTVPDLILGTGEGAQLCNGLVSIGVIRIYREGVWVTIANKRKNLIPGTRLNLNEHAYADFIGAKNNKGLFKVHCSDDG